ncbi:MAG: J domain-containing protein [Spirochaetaceae bacterium]|jgi:DnaJ-class molecular chaperone|nr:J domain-containing protein [Spirochaetaceae bacterium]
MGILDRLGDVIKSYLNDERDEYRPSHHDPDLADAFAELDDFLNDKSSRGGAEARRTDYSSYSKPRVPPESLRGDFVELGVPFGASVEVCKDAYKALLKRHHPDRHAGNLANQKMATEKSARVNAAYDRIVAWYTN